MKNFDSFNDKVVENIVRRAHYLANQMIFMANDRKDKQKGDPKVGGHSSASSSAIHICGALHLFVKSGFDHIANKPHASPADHAYNYLLNLFLDEQLNRISLEDANIAMSKLRAFSQNGEYVFQSYHSTYDPDHHNFFPSGTVGIPPVKAGYLAHAYTFTRDHGYNVPDAHFWAIMGDSEFREGSLFEAVPDFAEREIGNLTWIVDYNRQSLDGHRITNKNIMDGTDDSRIERTMAANGWQVLQVRHGGFRKKVFDEKGGETFKNWLEVQLDDYELQALLLIKNDKELAKHLKEKHKEISEFVSHHSEEEVFRAINDFGGHDIKELVKVLKESQLDEKRPTMVIAHTLKGWNLEMAAQQGNHSALPSREEMQKLKRAAGLTGEENFERFPGDTREGEFLRLRSEELYQDIKSQHQLKEQNKQFFMERLEAYGELPPSLNINLKMASYPHTQWMLGQLTSKLTRIANTPIDESVLADKQKPLSDEEKPWKQASELLVSMAPDVGTSTNLNPSMDGKIFGAIETEDFETEYSVKDNKLPNLVPSEDVSHRYIRFEIAEGNAMSCVGAYGKIRDLLGVPVIPLMTVYDFFIKRAMDQYFYNLYWKSNFILCGTPSGVTLSPEGAQHGWKSDFQIPNQITWEPFFCQELDWILCDAIKRHAFYDNTARNGVLVRGVTRGIEQKDFLKYLKTQKRFKADASENHLLCHKDYTVPGAIVETELPNQSDDQIFEAIRQDVLAGGYYLLNYQDYAGYEPGDNVVNIFAMGALGTEAIKASEQLLSEGIYANVVMVTSPDLLVGNLADENNYHHLRNNLNINSNLYLKPQLNGNPTAAELVTIAGRRVPIVSVHDGEPGLLDNIGSAIGVRQESLAVRKHSKCGRPSDVYAFQKIDYLSVIETAKKVLAETALEQVQVSRETLQNAKPKVTGDWRQLWPKRDSH